MNKMLTSAAAVLLAAAMIITGLGGPAVAQDQQEENERVLNLVVTAPHVVEVDEAANITVTDPETGEGVEEAVVFAMPISMQTFLLPTADYSLRLGETDAEGVLEYAFAQSGTYMLIAIANDYGPGIAGIIVSPEIVGKLEIQAPGTAAANETVDITVVERATLDPVAEADVWVVPHPGRRADTPDSEMDRMRADRYREHHRGRVWADLGEILSQFGLYIGETDEDGIVQFEFPETGRYVLVAMKEDYVPGIRTIRIVP